LRQANLIRRTTKGRVDSTDSTNKSVKCSSSRYATAVLDFLEPRRDE